MKVYCCERMSQEVNRKCDGHADPFRCPDKLINYDSCFDEYSLIIHDGGQSAMLIFYCPWCGTKLPNSKREQWHSNLEALGINPLEDNVPPEFENDAWWRLGPKNSE